MPRHAFGGPLEPHDRLLRLLQLHPQQRQEVRRVVVLGIRGDDVPEQSEGPIAGVRTMVRAAYLLRGRAATQPSRRRGTEEGQA